jgi:hypothetical protein
VDRLGGQLAQALGAPIDAIIAGAPDQIGMVTGRLAEAVEVASLITYLLSPLVANITGSDHFIEAAPSAQHDRTWLAGVAALAVVHRAPSVTRQIPLPRSGGGRWIAGAAFSILGRRP